MTLVVDIEKQLGAFRLKAQFEHETGVLGLLGASGCGKSVTLKCIAGIETPDRGRIVMDGRVLFDAERRIHIRPKDRRVGYLFQRYVLFPNMTVKQNIMSGMLDGGEDRQTRVEQAEEMMERFYLSEQAELYPHQLSGGQMQRVALARMLASRPAMILLDEPFSALDSYLKHRVEQTMYKLFEHYDGGAIYVTHNRDEVNHFCDRVCVMSDGDVVETLSKADLFRRPRRLASARLSGCKNFARITRRPTESNRVQVPAWSAVLESAAPVPEGADYLGIRSHHIRLTAAGSSAPGGDGPDAPNAIPVSVVRAFDNLFDMTVVVEPVAAGGRACGTQPLRIDLSLSDWAALDGADRLWAVLPPEQILWLKA